MLSLLNVIFSLYLGLLLLQAYEDTDWQVAVCEWAAVLAVEFYLATFYWDLGDEYFIQQVKEY